MQRVERSCRGKKDDRNIFWKKNSLIKWLINHTMWNLNPSAAWGTERREGADEWGERDMGHGEVTRDRMGHAEEFRLDLEVIQPLSDLDMICLFG